MDDQSRLFFHEATSLPKLYTTNFSNPETFEDSFACIHDKISGVDDKVAKNASMLEKALEKSDSVVSEKLGETHKEIAAKFGSCTDELNNISAKCDYVVCALQEANDLASKRLNDLEKKYETLQVENVEQLKDLSGKISELTGLVQTLTRASETRAPETRAPETRAPETPILEVSTEPDSRHSRSQDSSRTPTPEPAKPRRGKKKTKA